VGPLLEKREKWRTPVVSLSVIHSL
jgi:hypothetical protein